MSHLRLYCVLFFGWLRYLATGRTPRRAYLAMRELYFSTNGRSSETMAALYRLFSPKLSFGSSEDALKMKESSVETALSAVHKDGYFVVPDFLSAEEVRSLYHWAKETPAMPRFKDKHGDDELIDEDNLKTNIYDYKPSSLITHPIIQRLVSEPAFLCLCQRYFGLRPRLQDVSMWWSFKRDAVELGPSAQLFHTDLDTVKWLNFFFYLTDVTEDNGAHVFIRASHKGKPASVQRDGRISDEEVREHYSDEDFVKMIGKAGTLIVEDTKGLHKGGVVKEGKRLMLQLRFAINRFGAEVPEVPVDKRAIAPSCAQRFQDLAPVYSGYLSFKD